MTLLTDFGTRDGFVGAVKGVLATLAPAAQVHDIAHDLPRGDVHAAAAALARYWARWPAGTVHLVVVDPGVGTRRRALACAAAGRLLVGPDNGVLGPALGEGARCVGLEPRRQDVSPTFHGRDLFAPAAAALAAGGALDDLGQPVDDPVLLEVVEPVREGEGGRGVVAGVDRFGNLATNLPGAWARAGARVEIRGRPVALLRTYGDVDPGEVLALVDSEGRVEIAVRDGSAAEALDAGVGTLVRLLPPP